MRLRGRVARAAEAVARRAAAECPGLGVVNRLAADEAADPTPCPACGGCHVLVIEEVVVAADPERRPVVVTGAGTWGRAGDGR